jgi:hypothetical protein
MGRGGPGKLGGLINSAGSEGPSGAATDGSTADDSMVVFKVDPAKLPKAEGLKPHVFPSTLCVVVQDEEIKFIARGAFPNLVLSAGLAPIAAALPATRSLIARLKGIQDGASGSPSVAGNLAGETGSPPPPNARPTAEAPRGRPTPSKGATPAAPPTNPGQFSPN